MNSVQLSVLVASQQSYNEMLQIQILDVVRGAPKD